MPRLGDVVKRVRSKNAGPFWITIDVFCGDASTYVHIVDKLSTEAVAWLFDRPAEELRRFDIPDLHVIKFSLPRPVVQGHRFDRDMHGAQWAVLLAEMELDG